MTKKSFWDKKPLKSYGINLELDEMIIIFFTIVLFLRLGGYI